MSQQPIKPLFAFASNSTSTNNVVSNINTQLSGFTSFKEKVPPPPSSPPPSETQLKKRASDFFQFNFSTDDNIPPPPPPPQIPTEQTQLTYKPPKEKKRTNKYYDSNSDSSSDSDSTSKHRKKRINYTNNDREMIVNKLFGITGSDKSFNLDYRGDKTNVTIGLITKTNLPNYNQTVPDIMGLNGYQLRFNKKEGIVLQHIYGNSDKSSMVDRYWKSTLSLQSSKVLPLNSKSIKTNDNSDYIQLNTKPMDVDELDGDNQESEERLYLKKNSELSLLSEKEPHNIRNWIEFAEFQDNSIKFSHRKVRARIGILEKKLSIYRDALISNPKSDDLTVRYLRLASRLWDPAQVQSLWEKVLKRSSNDYLKNDNNNNNSSNSLGVISDLLWNEYLEFCLSNFTKFTVGSMRNTLLTVLKNLLQKRRSLNVRDKEFMDRVKIVECSILKVISQWTRFEEQSGYSERAVGFYQSLIEFNWFQPIHLRNSPHSTLLNQFKKYWDSNSPRIGEIESSGWSNTVKYDDEQQDIDSMSIEEMERLLALESNTTEPVIQETQEYFNIIHQSSVTSDEDLQEDGQLPSMDTGDVDTQVTTTPQVPESISNENEKLFDIGELEICDSQSHWFPAKITDDIGQDVDRIVLFDDLKDILFQIVCKDTKLELVYQFIEFIGVPISVRSGYDSVIRQESFENLLNSGNCQRLFKGLHMGNQESQTETPNWIPMFTSMTTPNKLTNDRIEFVNRIFNQLLTSEGNNNIPLVIEYIRFQSVYIDLNTAKDQCKHYLSTNRNQLELVHQYIKLEKQSVNPKTSDIRKLYQSTLNNIDNSNNSQQMQTIALLYLKFCKFEFKQIQMTLDKDSTMLMKFIRKGGTLCDILLLPIHVLCCFIEGGYKLYPSKTYTSSPVDKNRLSVCLNRYQQSNQNSWEFYLNYCLFTLFIGDIDSSLRVFKECQNKMTLESRGFEQLTVGYLGCLCAYSSRFHQPPPFRIKEVLLQCLNIGQKYYDHPKLLNLFLNWESKNQLVNNIRMYFDMKLLDKQKEEYDSVSLTFWLYQIRSEIYRLGSASKLKSIFDKALSVSSSSKHSIILWRLYILFELSRNRPKSSKSIYHRAIKELPWSKQIWFLPWSNKQLYKLFSQQELLDLISLINEKGMRISQIDLKKE
ncbi:DUF1740 family protein [Tieghemostelium lacteum]|uniref:DUF1740 family protein n=1 Tax=Tieghemostelium lacteum TaxID=361077 RepID=A0A151ZHF5_TIELA|nr:DUF1740 family protein [Tieghemostelium lacteum]|eukprot:KYQ93345.1 DUF1740 family protein [Tieghemostelium lacteum]